LTVLRGADKLVSLLQVNHSMDAIHITLPDGKVQEVPKGTTPADIAKKISPRLADAALVARVAEPNDGAGELVDLRRPLDRDVRLQILTEKDPDSLFVFRHSAAHLLAAAVMELYPNVKLGIGPPVETGFFYEFLRDEPFTPDDLAKIEKKMHELAAQDLQNERKLMPKPEAIELLLIAESEAPVRCRGGMRVLPDTTTSACNALDVLLVPGGQGTRTEVKNEALLAWIARVAKPAVRSSSNTRVMPILVRVESCGAR